MRFVVFNGPARSGKTTAVRSVTTVLRNRGYRADTDSFASPIKHFVAVLLGEKYDDIRKDTPYPELQNQTPRQVLIDLSELWMKPHYGIDVFGRMLYRRSLRSGHPPDFVLVDDSGFIPEFEALGERAKRILIRVVRPGFDFHDDSRAYLPDPNITLNNDSTLEDFFGACAATAVTLHLLHTGEIKYADL